VLAKLQLNIKKKIALGGALGIGFMYVLNLLLSRMTEQTANNGLGK
jgi:hypothetical protein